MIGCRKSLDAWPLAALILLCGFSIGLPPYNAPAQVSTGIARRPANPAQVELTWSSRAGDRFSIWASTNLATGFELLAAGLESAHPTNKWWTDLVSPSARFFRVSTNVAALPGDLVTNGGFDYGLAPWNTVVNSAVDAALTVANGELAAAIGTNAGTPVQIQLIQTGVPLTNGRSYTLRFKARSASLSRTIDARITSTNSSPRTNYLQQDSIPITPTMCSYTCVFVMTNLTDPYARLVFNLGGDTNDVWLDNVALYEGEWFSERADAHEMARRMGAGNNFMAAWAVAGKGAPEDAALLNRSGFSHCRIGFKMDELCGPAPNFNIGAADMQRLEDMVDYCLAEGLIAIVDPIHNWSNGPGYSTNDLPKLLRIWQQVAARFQSHPLDMVVFEIMNEPHKDSNISNITASALAAIRAFPGNQRRAVIVSGEGFSTRQALINAFDNDWIPANDAFLIGTFHYYDPRVFTKQGDPATNPSHTNVYWGSAAEVAQIDMDFDAVQAANQAWALRHGTEPLPIYLGEFGVDNAAPAADRKRWLSRVRMAAEQRGFAHAHWAMYNTEPDAKGMGPWTSIQIDNPASRTFDFHPLEALMTRYQAEAQTLNGGVTNSAAEPGFIGAGYALFPEAAGANVYCEVNGYIPSDGSYQVEVLYSAAAGRTLTLRSMNDASGTVQQQTVWLPATGQSSWSVLGTSLSFQAGENAKLRIIGSPDAGIKLDYVRISR